ncbi:MAG: hypothetical protein M3033_00120 [Acidobacteriota bacterium]|nr:hypothetical protein [Acidobacteriota bacterium]
MKKQLIITALLIVLLAAVLINLSCNGTTTPTNNTTVNNNDSIANKDSNSAQNNTEESILVSTNPDCSGNETEKHDKIKNGVEYNIRQHTNLKNQYDMANNFHFEPVVETNGDAALYIWGKIYITSHKDMDDFHKTFKYYRKQGCVKRIVFGPPPTIPLATPDSNNKILSAGFEIVACEDPNHLCSDGSCKEDCNGNVSISNTNVNMRSNTNTNSNSNTNTNTNSSANRKK